MQSLSKRLAALELATGEPRYYVAYDGYTPADDPRYVLPGGRVVDGDTFAQAVARDRAARVIRVQYQEHANER